MDSNVQVIFTILPVQSKVCGLTVQEMGSQDPVAVWKSLKSYGEDSFFIWGEAELWQRAAAGEGAGGTLLQLQGCGALGLFGGNKSHLSAPGPLKQRLGDSIWVPHACPIFCPVC